MKIDLIANPATPKQAMCIVAVIDVPYSSVKDNNAVGGLVDTEKSTVENNAIPGVPQSLSMSTVCMHSLETLFIALSDDISCFSS